MSVARFIADQRTNYRVPHTVVCALLGVSLAWFYKWLGRLRGPVRPAGLHTAAGPAPRHHRPRGRGRVQEGPWPARFTAAACRPAR